MQTSPTTPVPSLLPHLWKSTLVSGVVWFVIIGVFEIVSSFGIRNASKPLSR
ncbi:MAG TPA: hypothetical protein VFI55_07535 [Mycobacterium sp.]|nr:hypothetical protein [Mycobacterium sp.]